MLRSWCDRVSRPTQNSSRPNRHTASAHSATVATAVATTGVVLLQSSGVVTAKEVATLPKVQGGPQDQPLRQHDIEELAAEDKGDTEARHGARPLTRVPRDVVRATQNNVDKAMTDTAIA